MLSGKHLLVANKIFPSCEARIADRPPVTGLKVTGQRSQVTDEGGTCNFNRDRRRTGFVVQKSFNHGEICLKYLKSDPLIWAARKTGNCILSFYL